MRLLSNYIGKWKKKTTISEALLDLLLMEIMDARPGSELFIVSPWIRNISFQTSVRGDLRTVLDYTPTRISLLKLLEEFLRRGGKICIVCLPPHRLIQQEDINSLIQLVKLREEAEDHESKLLLSAQIAKTTSSVLMNKTMIDFLASLRRKQIAKVEVIYNERLHAKIYLGKHMAIIGSANITNSGFNFSDEVCIVDSDEGFVSAVRGFCGAITERGFSKRCEDYILDSYINIPDEEKLRKELHPEIEKLIDSIRDQLASKKRGEPEFSFYPYLEK